jgi:hypothetical protein
MKIISEPAQDICAMNLKPGEIAVITNWSIAQSENIGTIVKRHKSDLIKLNGSDLWSDFFLDGVTAVRNKCRVRVLPKGTVIEI